MKRNWIWWLLGAISLILFLSVIVLNYMRIELEREIDQLNSIYPVMPTPKSSTCTDASPDCKIQPSPLPEPEATLECSEYEVSEPVECRMQLTFDYAGTDWAVIRCTELPQIPTALDNPPLDWDQDGLLVELSYVETQLDKDQLVAGSVIVHLYHNSEYLNMEVEMQNGQSFELTLQKAVLSTAYKQCRHWQ